jgi:hypothetical protein
VIVAMEFAMAVVLLIGGGLLLHSFLRLSRVDPGFNPWSVTSVSVRSGRRRGPHSQHGQKTETKRLFMCRGGMLIRRFWI